MVSTHEVIDLSGVAAISGFGDLSGNHLSLARKDAVIDDGKGNSITLSGVNISDLSAGDFVF